MGGDWWPCSQLLADSELEGLKSDLKRIEEPLVGDFNVFRRKIEEAGTRYEIAAKRLNDADAYLLEVALQLEELAEVKQALQDQVSHEVMPHKNT